MFIINYVLIIYIQLTLYFIFYLLSFISYLILFYFIFYLFQFIYKTNKYNSMKSNLEKIHYSKQKLQKRIFSANFQQKKIKNVLTFRPNCQQKMLVKKSNVQNFNQISIKTISDRKQIKKYSLKDRIQIQCQHRKSQKLVKYDLKKQLKYQKTNQQVFMLKNSNKTKLIYWNDQIQLIGNQKYIVLSADLIIDQDNFWDKLPSNNGKQNPNEFYYNNTSKNLTHKMSSTLKSNRIENSNLKIGQTTTNKFIQINKTRGDKPYTNRKNPLLKLDEATKFVKQWKKLHNQVDDNKGKVLILWIIRRQETYFNIMQLVRLYNLPLHCIFYVKRKRQNYFVDINPIIKFIYQNHIEILLKYPQNDSNLQKNSVFSKSNKNQFSNSKKQQFKGKQKIINKQKINKEYLKEVISDQIILKFGSVTNRIQNKNRIQRKQKSDGLENDQNAANLLNTEINLPSSNNISKQFLKSRPFISKNEVNIFQNQGNNKKNEFIKNTINQLNEKQEQGKIKNQNHQVKFENQVQKQKNRQLRSINFSPQLKKHQYEIQMYQFQKCFTSIQIQTRNLLNRQSKSLKSCIKQSWICPQIVIIQGVKCNEKDEFQIQSYNGKIPLLFEQNKQNMIKIKKQLTQNKGNAMIKDDQVKGIRAFIYKYEQVSEKIIENINDKIKNGLSKGESNTYNIINDRYSYQASSLQYATEIQSFLQAKILEIYQQFIHIYHSDDRQGINKSNFNDEQSEQISQQVQSLISQKTQRKLEQIKKRLIDNIITLKGRSYTFENGESIYYYVGDIFKRNYDNLYEQYYNQFKRQCLQSNEPTQNKIKHSQCTPHNNKLIKQNQFMSNKYNFIKEQRIVIKKIQQKQNEIHQIKNKFKIENIEFLNFNDFSF